MAGNPDRKKIPWSDEQQGQRVVHRETRFVVDVCGFACPNRRARDKMQPSWFYSWTTLYLTKFNEYVVMSCELFIMRMKNNVFVGLLSYIVRLYMSIGNPGDEMYPWQCALLATDRNSALTYTTDALPRRRRAETSVDVPIRTHDQKQHSSTDVVGQKAKNCLHTN